MIRVLLAHDEAIMQAGLRLPLSGEPDMEVVGEAADGNAAVRAVVAGFLLKVSPPGQLLGALREVAAGRGLLEPAVVPRVIGRYADAPQVRPRDPALAKLTGRETEVLALVGRGLSNAEIAASLYLGETTVKNHLGRALDKLGLRDRARAIAYAYESGLISPGGN